MIPIKELEGQIVKTFRNASCTHHFYIPYSQFNIGLQYCNQNCKNTIINIIRVIIIKQSMKHIKLKNQTVKQSVGRA